MGQMFSLRMFSRGRDGDRDTGRPRSPPRELSAVLKSPVLTNDFRTYLADLDDEAGEGNIRVTWLNFVLSCRRLKDLQDSDGVPNKKGAVALYLREMHADYFSDQQQLALSNGELWEACDKLCLRGKGDPGVLWKAHDDVMRKLDDIHQPFLVTKGRAAAARTSSLPDVIQQCLL